MVGIQSPMDASLIFKSLRKLFQQIDNGNKKYSFESSFEEGMPLVLDVVLKIPRLSTSH